MSRNSHQSHADKESRMNLPDVVSEAEWEASNDRIIAKEKALTKESDALAAERQRQLDRSALGRQESWETRRRDIRRAHPTSGGAGTMSTGRDGR
jgi:Bacterial protein of unknown function (DUF899)